MKPSLLILAAGLGSRYGNLKQMDQLGPHGETIMDYSVFDAIRAGFGKVVFVIRRDLENEFNEFIISRLKSKIEVHYVLQELDMLPEGFTCPAHRKKPWGTGHAILMAEKIIQEPFAMINADDFYGNDAFQVMSSYLSNQGRHTNGNYSMVGYPLRHTLSEFGAVSRGVCSLDPKGFLASVEEKTHILKSGNTIEFTDSRNHTGYLDASQIVSMNFWGFTPCLFDFLREQFTRFLLERGNDLNSEFYIPDVVNRLIGSKQASVYVLRTGSEWFGLTYAEDRKAAVDRIQNLIRQGIYPEKLW